MNFLIPLMMFGWIPFTIILFQKFPAQKAILISVIGGVLFLPVASYDIPMIEYDKVTAIAVALLLGIIVSWSKNNHIFKPKLIDLPIIIWCIVSPLLTILSNGLGIYNAIANILTISLSTGIFYFSGRIYFSDKDALRSLTTGILIGGLIYIPLVLFEVRMSPQLSRIVYGFMPGSWFQSIRYGGYRPVVFMDHGLMVSFWIAATSTVALWLYGTKELTKFKNIPMFFIVILFIISSILCKSANGIVFLIIGGICFLYYKKIKSNLLFKIIILCIPVYIIFRLSGILSIDEMINYLSKGFDADRIESLSVRLRQEELFGAKAFLRPILGWGWMNRAWPIDILTGETAIRMIDSLFMIVFSVKGILGLISFYCVLLLGPWKIFKFHNKSVDINVLSLILIFCAIDTLMNGFINPVFFVTAGSLITISEKLKMSQVS